MPAWLSSTGHTQKEIFSILELFCLLRQFYLLYNIPESGAEQKCPFFEIVKFCIFVHFELQQLKNEELGWSHIFKVSGPSNLNFSSNWHCVGGDGGRGSRAFLECFPRHRELSTNFRPKARNKSPFIRFFHKVTDSAKSGRLDREHCAVHHAS